MRTISPLIAYFVSIIIIIDGCNYVSNPEGNYLDNNSNIHSYYFGYPVPVGVCNAFNDNGPYSQIFTCNNYQIYFQHFDGVLNCSSNDANWIADDYPSYVAYQCGDKKTCSYAIATTYITPKHQ